MILTIKEWAAEYQAAHAKRLLETPPNTGAAPIIILTKGKKKCSLTK
jgi:hypothetical protein